MIEPHSKERLKAHLPANFTDDFLLNRALTHSSYINENRDAIEENERLEFLGDAVVSFIVAEWLYNRYPEKKEGFLTKIRAALVRTNQLAEFARSIELGPAILLGRGEDAAGGRNRDAILCDAFEALIAAMYLSTDLDTVRAFIIPLIEDQSEKILLNHTEEDAKSRLQEWAQSKGFATPVYHLVSETGPDHAKQFKVSVLVNGEEMGTGIGSSKQQAEKEAALAALHNLGMTA